MNRIPDQDPRHCGTQTIPMARLTLRRFTVDDAPAMFRNWASDPDVTRFLTWPTHADESVSRAVLAEWCASYADPACYHWAIVPNALQEPIGSISVVSHRDDIAMAHVGYCIGRAWWRQGYASEALSSVIDYLFRNTALNRIEARHDPENPRSGHVMRACGMLYEGTMRQADINNRGVCDYALYAMLREDYERRDAHCGLRHK